MFTTNYTFANNEQYAYVNVFNSTSNITSTLQEMYGITTAPTKTYTQNLDSVEVNVQEYINGMFVEGVETSPASSGANGTSGSPVESNGSGGDSVTSIEAVTSCPANKSCRAGLIRVFKTASYTYVVSEDIKITNGEVKSVGLSFVKPNSNNYQNFLGQVKEAVKKERSGMIAL